MDIMAIVYMVVPTLITVVLGYFAISGKVSRVGKEVAELLNVLSTAVADSKLTRKELEDIIREAKDIPEALKSIKDKESSG